MLAGLWNNLFLPSLVTPIATLTFTVMDGGAVIYTQTFTGTNLTYQVT